MPSLELAPVANAGWSFGLVGKEGDTRVIRWCAQGSDSGSREHCESTWKGLWGPGRLSRELLHKLSSGE